MSDTGGIHTYTHTHAHTHTRAHTHTHTHTQMASCWKGEGIGEMKAETKLSSVRRW